MSMHVTIVQMHISSVSRYVGKLVGRQVGRYACT